MPLFIDTVYTGWKWRRGRICARGSSRPGPHSSTTPAHRLPAPTTRDFNLTLGESPRYVLRQVKAMNAVAMFPSQPSQPVRAIGLWRTGPGSHNTRRDWLQCFAAAPIVVSPVVRPEVTGRTTLRRNGCAGGGLQLNASEPSRPHSRATGPIGTVILGWWSDRQTGTLAERDARGRNE